MAMTVSDILMNADAFRRAYPHWPHPELEKGLPMTATECWADPLSRKERRALAEKLARSCGTSWRASEAERLRFRHRNPRLAELAQASALAEISIEASQLHLDVTERAEVPVS